MLTGKGDWILIHNLHVLESYSTKKLIISELPLKEWLLRSLSYLLKNCEKLAQQIDSRAVADLAHHVLLRCSQWFDTQSGGCTRHTQNCPSDCQGNWHFAEVSGSHHTQRHLARFSESAWRNDFSMVGNPTQHHWSRINHWRNRLNARVKAKGKHFEHCCDVFVVTVNLSWRLMLALLWLWTVWHVLCFTR